MPTEADNWQPMDTAPRDRTPIRALLPNGEERTVMWAWGGGWAGEFDQRRPRGIGGWLSLNDAHQPVKWRHFDPPRMSIDDPAYIASLQQKRNPCPP
jgi:hypothetical protein